MAAAAMAFSKDLVGAQNTRAYRRYMVLASRNVTWGGERRLGLVRDISRGGLFLYSNFQPSLGDNIEIATGRGPRCSRITGAVVRVEAHAEGAAVGIALRIVTRSPKR